MNKYLIFVLNILFLSIKILKGNIHLNNTSINGKSAYKNNIINSKVKINNLTEKQKIFLGNKRKLDDEFKPIRIYLSTAYINFQMGASSSLRKMNELFISLLNETKNEIEQLINVKPLNYPIKVGLDVITSNNFRYDDFYDTKIVNAGIDYDLAIFFSVNDEASFKYMTSINILRDNCTNRTIVGGIDIPISLILLEGNNNIAYIKYLLFHHFTHIFGFSYDSFQYFPGGLENTLKTEIDSRGINRTYIITPTVIKLAKQYFNCSQIIGLPLEDQKEDENPFSHWEARILLGEYMNSIQYEHNTEVYISEFTLALLEDSGWYKINYFTGGLMRFGKNRGCEFLNNDCCNNQGITKFKNEFFDIEDNNNPSCSSGRLSRTYNLYKTYSQTLISNYREIINHNNIGGITKNADYCFGFTNLESEESNINIKYEYVGHCKMGNGSNYGSEIIYKDGQRYKNSENENELGEKFSNNSFCVLSEAYPKGNQYYNKYDSIIHPICYEMNCSNNALTIKIKDQYVVCPKKGGKVEINGDFQGYLYCPDYNLICTGIEMCNDMFDCIKKKSLPRNLTYDYDFDIEKTSSQKISEIRNYNIVYGYEINDEGICPEYCSQCKDIKRCFKCIDGYKLLGNKDNDTEPIICDNKTNISIGYFIQNDVYYPCIEYCVECNNSYTCLKCDNIHKTNDDKTKCIDKVQNCESYTSITFTCEKCKGEYVFIGDDRDNCYIINDKTKFYTLDNGISYFPCNNSISNCDICNNNRYNCSKCNVNYYLINDNTSYCFNDKNLSKYYTNNNGISYIFCNNSIPFCDTCNNSIECETCGYNHYFIKYDRINCVTDLNLKNYYTEDYGISYFPCNETINYCQECDKKDICQKCINDYYMIGDNRTICRNDFDKNKYYTEDNIVYYPCDTNFEYCDECINKNTCTKCINNYGFLGNDRNKCYLINSNEYYTEDDGISFYPCSYNLLNCEQCLNKTYCLKCNTTFHFIKTDRTKCFSISNYNEYYTEDNGISYYPCNTGISNCKTCTSKFNCTKCEPNYYFIGNDRNYCINDINILEYYTLDGGTSYFPCRDAMQNCKNCIIPTNCMECQENTYFLRNDTSKCLSLNLKEYYTENGKNYYPCYESMNYCVECYNKNFCSKCNNNYFLKYENPNICYDLATFQNDKTYYKLNDTHYKKCSSSINNCVYCNSGIECTQCENNYYFVNENVQQCTHINKITPIDEYYKIDEKNYYSCGYEKIVENCKKCISPTICSLCKEGYAFQSDKFNKCYLKEDMKIGFYHNQEETMYYPCIDNCDYCTNGEKCQQCAINNELLFEKSLCGNCQIEFFNINDELKLETIHSLVKMYISNIKNNYTYIPFYINNDKNYSIIIFRSWECTKHLLSLGYFHLDVYELSKIITEKNGDTISSLTYVFVNYGNNINYIEIYNSDGNLINLKQMCPECLNSDYILRNNISNVIYNSFGKEIINNIVINNINVFNETDSIFVDFCSNFTIQKFDIPLKERRDILYLGNQANELVCLDTTCEISNISIIEFIGSCNCTIQSELSLILQETENKKINFDKKGNNNFPVFTCYKNGFNKKYLKSNVGFFIGIILIVIQIILFVLYIISIRPSKKLKIPGNPPNSSSNSKKKDVSDLLFLENFDEIMKENGKKIIDDKENIEMDYQDRDDLSEELVSQDDEELENKKTLDFLLTTESPLTQRGKRHNSKIKDLIKEKNIGLETYSVRILSGKNRRNEKLLFKNSENDSSIKYSRNKKRQTYSKNSGEINSKSSFESNDGLNVKQIQKKNFSSRIYNSLNDAKKFNKTSFFDFYFFILGLRQPIINLFVNNKCLCLGDDYVPFYIKIIRFIFIISLIIFMNTLHLNHKYFYGKFEYFDNKYDLKNIYLDKGVPSSEIFSYALKHTAIFGFISFIICYLVQEILNRFLINNRKELDDIINSTIGKVKDEKIREILQKPRRKYIIIISVNFAFMIIFYYFITNFFGVYRGGIIDYLASSLITFIFIQGFPFILCLVFALLRYFGIKNSNQTLYKIGQLVIY